MKILLMILLFLNVAFAKKIALLIGNSDYEKGALTNPVNDVLVMKDTLTKLGFDVTYKTNLKKDEMQKEINNFASSVTTNDIALFYYSGHGMQYESKNYLIPLKANAVKAGQIPSVGVSLDFVLGGLYDAKLAIVLLDACRDTPFKSFSRGGTKGLAQVQSRSGNYIVSYATEAGKVAADGNGNNSPYVLALKKYFQEPLPIETIFRKVRGEVKRLTGDQYPYFEPHFDGEFYFTKPKNNLLNTTERKANIEDKRDKHYIPFTKIDYKATECKNSLNQKYYFKRGYPSKRKALFGKVSSSTVKGISSKQSKVNLWTSDDALVTECNQEGSWKRYSSISPGNNEYVVAMATNCTYHKPKNKENRFLQFSYKIGVYDISYEGGLLYPYSGEMVYYTLDDLKNQNLQTREFKNIGFKNLKILDLDCINIELQYCGDGIVETSEGEECDPEAEGYSKQTCNEWSCKLK